MVRIESSGDYPTLEKLVREPSPSALLEAFVAYESLKGQFARLDDLLVVLPLAPKGMSHACHGDILPAGLMSFDETFSRRVRVAAEVAEASSDERMLAGGMHDAGWYVVGITNKRVQNLYVEGQSFGFGRADVAGRQLSIMAFRAAMGPEVNVEPGD